jgi:hypothetical protein
MTVSRSNAARLPYGLIWLYPPKRLRIAPVKSDTNGNYNNRDYSPAEWMLYLAVRLDGAPLRVAGGMTDEPPGLFLSAENVGRVPL